MSIYIVYPSDIWYLNLISGIRLQVCDKDLYTPILSQRNSSYPLIIKKKNSSIIYIQNNFKLEKETLLWQR